MKQLLPMLALALSGCVTGPADSAVPTATLGQTAYVDGLRVSPLSIIEDSRCPANVQCVWAGRIVVRTEIRGGNWREVRDLELGKPQPVADGEVTLVAAEPGKLAGAETDPRAYRLTFAFQGGL